MEDLTNLDLTPFICEAFSDNPKTYNRIEWIYKHNLRKYKKALEDTFLCKSEILTEGDLLKNEYGKKTYALLLHLNDREVFQGVLKIIETNWSYIYTYVINKSSIDLEQFIKSVKERNKGDNMLSIKEINTNLVIATFLTNLLKKPITENSFSEQFFNILLERYNRNDNNERKTSNFYFYMKRETKEKLQKKKMLIDNKYPKIREVAKLEDIPRTKIIADTLETLFRSEGFGLSSLLDRTRLSEKDMDGILLTFLKSKKETDPTLREYTYLLCIKSLLKLYKETKEYYFENEKDNAYTDEKLLTEIEILNALNIKKDLTIDSLEIDNAILKKEKEKLKNDLKLSDDLLGEYNNILIENDKKSHY